MGIKILLLMLLSLLLFINSVSLNDHQVLSSHDLAHAHEHWFGFHAMPRKLMLNPKVKSAADKDLVLHNDDLSGDQSHKGGEGEETSTTTTSSKVSTQEGSYPTCVFTMDYSHVRRRRPVHNKLLPSSTTSP